MPSARAILLLQRKYLCRIARDFITDLSPKLAADKAHILRSIAGHIVAGTATDIERKQLGSILAALEK